MKKLSHPLSRRLWRQYISRRPLHAYAKGETIILEDEVPTHVHIIESGIVRVYNITAEGEERTVSFDVAGEIFPIGWAMGRIEKTEYFYEALTDCEVRQIGREDLLSYLRLRPKTALALYTDVAGRYTSLQKRIYALEQSKASEKILYTLSYLSDKFGKSITSTRSQLQIPLTQQEIANFLGLTRETTSTELKKLENAKVISSKHQKYTINTTKLAALLEKL